MFPERSPGVLEMIKILFTGLVKCTSTARHCSACCRQATGTGEELENIWQKNEELGKLFATIWGQFEPFAYQTVPKQSPIIVRLIAKLFI